MKGFYRFRFLFFFFIFFGKWLIYLVSSLWVVGYLWVANCFVSSETPKHNNFDQFWKFKFHFKHFPRNTRFLSFDVPSNYFYLFKNSQQTFSWTGECPSSYLKVTKMWFGQNIKYISEPFFAGFCYREGISCFYYIGYIIRLTYFLQTEYFHCMWYLKTLDAHLVVPFATVAAICYKISIIWLNIIMRVVFPTDIIYIKNKEIDLRPENCLSVFRNWKQPSNCLRIKVISNDEFSSFHHGQL